MEKERESLDPVQSGVAVYDDSSLDLPPPLYPCNKKRKTNEGDKNNESDSDSYSYSDSDSDEDEEYCRELDAYIYRFKGQTMDTINAVKMLYDIHDMFKLRLDAFIFASFVQHSNYRNCLNYFDAYGDPRCGGFYHMYGPNIPNDYVKPAKFALHYYSTHCNPDAKLTFVKLEKASCCPQGDDFHYVTFIARDEVADVERTYQALVLEYEYDDYFYAKYVASADKDHDCAKYAATTDKDDDCAKYAAADKDDGCSKYAPADKDDDCSKCTASTDKYDDCAKYAAATDKDNDCPKYASAYKDYDFGKYDDTADVNDSNYILGMLRVKDPTHDHVLAIIQLKPGVNHEDVIALNVKRRREEIAATDL